VKNTLSIKNPSYNRILRITGNRWGAQAFFKYYKIDKSTGDLTLPRGFFDRFVGYLHKKEIEYSMSIDMVGDKMENWNTSLWKEVDLRDYQQTLLKDVLANEIGVVYAGTGSGKSVLTCEIVRKLGLKTTIIVPKTILASQFKDEFKKWFNYDVGIVDATHKEINKDVVVATWQSLASKPELARELGNKTGLLVVDENNEGISKTRAKTLECFRPLRMFGLSGTPRKSKDSGQTEAIFFYYGPIVAEYKPTMIIPTVEVVYTKVDIPVSANYHEMIDSMVNNDDRNNLIKGLATLEVFGGRKVLILTKRREHCTILAEKLKGFNIYYADSDDKDRNEILGEMRSGERDFNILIGTGALLSSGVDIPSLDVLILCGDLKTDVGLEQSAGRVLRLSEGKESAKIIDLVDDRNPILKRQWYERNKLYKSKGWEVKF